MSSKLKHNLDGFHNKKVVIDGKEYDSKKDAMTELGIGRNALNKLLSGKKLKNYKITIDGIEYTNKSQAMQILGISYKKLNRLLNEQR